MTFESARAIATAIRTGQTSAVDVCRAALDRMRAANDRIFAFTTIAEEQALARAAAVDADRSRWDTQPLLGVPVALKDNFCTTDMKTTACSRMLEHYTPPYNATVVERLLAAGAVIVGKTNCDEFAMGSSTENSAFGPTRNPWALDRTPGGSSGGSAAAVAAGMVPLAFGSDTGGSIRQPAAMCGVVGLKPTYSRVSRYGLLAFASSLDQIGPIAATVEDAALALHVTAGWDPRDASSSTADVADYPSALTGDVRGVRIGVPWALTRDGVDDEIRAAFARAIETLKAQGAIIVDVDLPHSPHAIPVYYLICTAEASSNLARYDGVRYGSRAMEAETLTAMYDRTRDVGFGAEVKRRILLGTYVLTSGYYDAYYLKAQQVRTLIRRDYEVAWDSVDLVAMPTSPIPAFRLGERTDDPLQMYLADVFTVAVNLAGLPAISIPCGFTSAGLPCSLQLTGRAMDEATVLRVADGFEKATDRQYSVLRRRD